VIPPRVARRVARQPRGLVHRDDAGFTIEHRSRVELDLRGPGGAAVGERPGVDVDRHGLPRANAGGPPPLDTPVQPHPPLFDEPSGVRPPERHPGLAEQAVHGTVEAVALEGCRDVERRHDATRLRCARIVPGPAVRAQPVPARQRCATNETPQLDSDRHRCFNQSMHRRVVIGVAGLVTACALGACVTVDPIPPPQTRDGGRIGDDDIGTFDAGGGGTSDVIGTDAADAGGTDAGSADGGEDTGGSGDVISARAFAGASDESVTALTGLPGDRIAVALRLSDAIELDDGGATITPPTAGDVAIAVYDAATGEAVSRFAFGGDGVQIAHALAPTADGDVLVAGSSETSRRVILAPRGSDGPAIDAGARPWVARYAPDGQLRWGRVFDSPSTGDIVVRAWDVVETNDGGVVVAGHFRGTLDVGDDEPLQSDNNSADLFVVRLDAATGETDWSFTIGGGGNDGGEVDRGWPGGSGDVAVEVIGENLLVVGTFEQTVELSGTASTFEGSQLTSAGGRDVFVARYRADFGRLSEAVRFGGETNEALGAGAVDVIDDDLYVAARAAGPLQFGGAPVGDASTSLVIAAFDVALASKWAVTIGSDGGYDLAAALAAGDDDILVVGAFQGSLVPERGRVALHMRSSRDALDATDAFALRIGRNGVPDASWQLRAVGDAGVSLAAGAAVDDRGIAWIGGWLEGATERWTAEAGRDGWLVRLEPFGR